jgi:23S rRNA (cytidine1920-2'-O)/16S rRNA (cytidine1409-2'-O)-methyltransferase
MSAVEAARGARVRLDELLVTRRLAASRAEAARMILAGLVRLPGGATPKAGRLVAPDVVVERVAPAPYVGRGGEKLAAALDAFGVRVEGRVCLDVGASTGGFTDCLLTRGARHVHAVDVGQGQLHPRLRADARVSAWEGVNARHLAPDRFLEAPSLATVDVSFISLEKVLPAVAACLAPSAEVVALVKPQFEVGRGQVGRGGVVRGWEARRAAVRGVVAAAAGLGLGVAGVAASVLRGPKGNREVFVHLRRGAGAPPALAGAGFEAALAAEIPATSEPAPSGRVKLGRGATGRRRLDPGGQAGVRDTGAGREPDRAEGENGA